MRGRRILRRGVVAVLAAAVLAAIGWAIPPVRARAKAVAVLARAMGVAFPRPFAARVLVRHVTLASGVYGDLYLPGGPAPVVILSPGGNPLGKDDPDLVRVARSMAGARRIVFVPQLELRHQRFAWSDVTALTESILALGRLDPGHRVGLVGFSYGGSFCLLAAEDPRVAGDLAFVATFGSFDSLVDVVQGITTGATTLGGRLVPWHTEPEASAIMDHAAIGLLPSPEQGPLATALAEGRAAGLSPDDRAVFDLLENRDPWRTRALAADLPLSFRAALARFSPATNLRWLRAPLFVMQSEDDPATPPTEALRLHDSVPGSRLVLLRYFHHVYPPGRGAPLRGDFADGWGAWRFVSWILSAQE